MSDSLIAPFGGVTENPPDFGDRETTLTSLLVTGDVVPVDTSGNIGGFPPAFPWGGHSNGVSKR